MRSIHAICMTLPKMADGCEDEVSTFQFIEEVQNSPDLWDRKMEELAEKLGLKGAKLL